MKRLLSWALLALGAAILGFGLALLIATEFVYPGPRELDGGLARLSFAMGGAFAGFAAGVLLGLVLKPALILRAALIALLLGGLTLVAVAWRASRQPAALTAAPLLFDEIHSPVLGFAVFGPICRHRSERTHAVRA